MVGVFVIMNLWDIEFLGGLKEMEDNNLVFEAIEILTFAVISCSGPKKMNRLRV